MLLFRNIVLTIILIVITYTDLKRREIDHEPIIIGLTFIVLFSLCGFNDVSVKSSILGFLIGGITFTILAFGGMGGGDVKLMALIGFFLGWKLTILAMYLSFVLGTVIGILYMAFKKVKMKEFIPFGPAIAGATALVMFFGAQIINKFEFLWFLR